MQANEEVAAHATDVADNDGKRAQITAIIAMALGLTISLVFGITIAVGITKPVGIGVGFAKKIAKGELDIDLSVQLTSLQ